MNLKKQPWVFGWIRHIAILVILFLGAVASNAQVAGCGGGDTRPFASTRGIQQRTMTFGQASWLDQALCGLIYFLQPNTSRLPDFSFMRPVGAIYARQLNIPIHQWEEGFPGITNRVEWFGIEYHGVIRAGLKGSYSLRLVSDDGSRVYIDDRLIVDNDGLHSKQSASGSVYLDPEQHTIRVQYFQGPRYLLGLQLFCTPQGGVERLFPDCGIELETPGETRTSTDSRIMSYEAVDEEIHYGKIVEGECKPSGAVGRCTPIRAVVDARSWGRYHVLLPAQLIVGLPNVGNLQLAVGNAEGQVCWEATNSVGCNGPEGGQHVQTAGPGFLIPGKKPGALVWWTTHNTTFFAVNGRIGKLHSHAGGLSEFNGHEGSFEFDVQAAPPAVLGSVSANAAGPEDPMPATIAAYMVPINPAKETWTVIANSGNAAELERFAAVFGSSELAREAVVRARKSRNDQTSSTRFHYGISSARPAALNSADLASGRGISPPGTDIRPDSNKQGQSPMYFFAFPDGRVQVAIAYWTENGTLHYVNRDKQQRTCVSFRQRCGAPR